MQATYVLKPFSFRIVALVCGLMAAAIIGAAGGYWLKSLDFQRTSAAAAVPVQQPSLIGENASQSAATVLQPSLVGENASQSAAVYDTAGVASMVGENARQDAAGSTQAVLDRWEIRLIPSEKLREGHRR